MGLGNGFFIPFAILLFYLTSFVVLLKLFKQIK